MTYFYMPLFLLFLLVSAVAHGQVLCTHSAGGTFLCFTADGRTPAAVPDEYRKPSAPIAVENKAVQEQGNAAIAKTAAPAGKAPAMTTSQPGPTVNLRIEAPAVPATGAARICSWESGKGVTCQ